MLEQMHNTAIELIIKRNQLRAIKADTTEVEEKLDCYPSFIVLNAIEWVDEQEKYFPQA